MYQELLRLFAIVLFAGATTLVLAQDPAADVFPEGDAAAPGDVAAPAAPADLDTAPADNEAMGEEATDEEAMDKPAKEMNAETKEEGGVGLGRPYYSPNGAYENIILFDRHRLAPNDALPFYAIDGRYTNEVIHDDPILRFEESQAYPDMWPWRTYYTYPNWTVPFEHGDFGAGSHGVALGWSAPINWPSYAAHQLTDFRMRKRKANEINGVYAGRPHLNQLQYEIDWMEHSWPQMHDMSLRLEYAGRLREKGVHVDYRKYSPEQLLNFLSRVNLAAKLKALGTTVNWRVYSWRQLYDLLDRVERAKSLVEQEEAADAETPPLFGGL